MSKKNDEIFLGDGNHINMKTSSLVSTQNGLKLITPNDGAITLNVKIEADFGEIPKKYHEVFLNIFSSKYTDTASFSDNPFSLCKLEPKKKWYQLWKK